MRRGGEPPAAFSTSAQHVLDAQVQPAALVDRDGIVIGANSEWLELARRHRGFFNSIGNHHLAAFDDLTARVGADVRAELRAAQSVLMGKRDELHVEKARPPSVDQRLRLRITRLVHADLPFALLVLLTDDEAEADEASGLSHERQQHQLERLAAASVKIAAAGSPEATLQAITDEARQAIPAHLAATHNIASNLWPEAAVATSLSAKYRDYCAFATPPDGTGIYADVVRTRRPLRLDHNQLLRHPAWRGHAANAAGHPPLRNLLAAPICARDGRCFGVVMLSDRIDGEFTAEDEAVLVQLAQIASVCIRNALDAKAHRDAEARLQATQEHVNIAIGECDADGRYVQVNSGFTSLTGYSQAEIVGRTFFEFTHPEDLETEREHHRAQLRGEIKAYTLEKRFRHKDGSARWSLLSASAVFDSDGKFLYAIRVLQDIDERKRKEEKQAEQVRELHHRVRNTLATVQGMMGATGRSASNYAEFKDVFSARLASIARAHTLLTTDDWQTAPLAGLLQGEIDAMPATAAGRIDLDGPPLDLPANLAIVLSMAIHELADNAIRHGSLSEPKGEVLVRWDVRQGTDRKYLSFQWVERSGPPAKQTSKTGYGTTLLTKVLPVQAGATSSLAFDASGATFRLEAPLVAPK